MHHDDKLRCYGQTPHQVGSLPPQLCLSFLDNSDAIIMGTHKEGGASTFWSYVLNLPLSSNAMVSWKFCYLLHKVLRDGHRNVRPDSVMTLSVLFLPAVCDRSSFVWPAGCQRLSPALSQREGHGHPLGEWGGRLLTEVLVLEFSHL